MMAKETRVLGGDHGAWQGGRKEIDRRPPPLRPSARAPPPQHERRDRIDDTVERGQQIRQDEEESAGDRQNLDGPQQPYPRGGSWQRDAYRVVGRHVLRPPPPCPPAHVGEGREGAAISNVKSPSQSENDRGNRDRRREQGNRTPRPPTSGCIRGRAYSRNSRPRASARRSTPREK